jgi:predicted DNA-binding transcriptional regulator AlpA
VSESLRQDRAPARNPETVDLDRMIQARGVAARYDISVRTIDRWLQKPHLAFPQPVMVTRDIAGRVSARFWRLGELIAWERAQAVNRADNETTRIGNATVG